MRIILIISCFLAVVLSGCDAFDKEETVPIEIFVPRVVFQDTSFGQQNHQLITDVWAYEDNGSKRKLLGLYPLPAKIPIYSAGARLILRAGIYSDGISGRKINHVHFSEDTLVVTKSDSFVPSFGYARNIARSGVFLEDFEGQRTVLEKLTAGKADIQISSKSSLLVDSINGNGFGYMEARSDTDQLRFISTSVYDISFNRPVYLEIDVRNSVLMRIGVHAFLPDGSVYVFEDLNIVPQDEWTKIYVGLTDEINQLYRIGDPKFKISGGAVGALNKGDFIAVDNMRITFLK